MYNNAFLGAYFFKVYTENNVLHKLGEVKSHYYINNYDIMKIDRLFSHLHKPLSLLGSNTAFLSESGPESQ